MAEGSGLHHGWHHGVALGFELSLASLINRTTYCLLNQTPANYISIGAAEKCKGDLHHTEEKMGRNTPNVINVLSE